MKRLLRSKIDWLLKSNESKITSSRKSFITFKKLKNSFKARKLRKKLGGENRPKALALIAPPADYSKVEKKQETHLKISLLKCQ